MSGARACQSRFALGQSLQVLLGDTGLLCHKLGLDSARLQSDDLMTGAALESLMASEITKQISWSQTAPRLCHYP
ncbi:MAG: DUF4143 domain-containing protein [Verrucomicrobiales bacterium]